MRPARLLVVVLLVVAGGALAWAGAMPEGFRTVAEIIEAPDAWEGRSVELKATVLAGSLERDGDVVRFLVADGAHALPVEWPATMPLPENEAGGTIEGRSIIAKGVVSLVDGLPVLVASDLKVGCASKYEPE